ncbi:MAG: hypothetical protein ABR614_02545 [Mycobacteriales bacterium]
MREPGPAVLLDVEDELAAAARELERAERSTYWWRGTAADSARALWKGQARALRSAAATLAEAQVVLRQYVEEAAAARLRRERAERVLADVGPLDELYRPGAAARAHTARAERARAQVELDEAARRLAARLAVLESAAGLPAARPGPCAPPAPAAPARGWGRVVGALLGASSSGRFDPQTCEPIPLLEAGGGGAILRGLTRRKAAGVARERLVADAADAVLRNPKNDHAFKHVDQLFGHKNISKAQRMEWARLIGAGLQSSETFAYKTVRVTGVGHLHRQYGRHWVIVQDVGTGEVVTAFMPNNAQLAAIRRLIRGR